MTPAVDLARCEHCGTTSREVCWSEPARESLCLSCHTNETRGSETRYEGLGTRDKERQARREGEAEDSSLVSPSPLVSDGPLVSPSPLVSPQGAGSEVEELLALYKRGGVEPVVVELRPVQDGAPEVVRRVAVFFALIAGLRLAAGDDRPVPFACGWVGERLDVPKLTVWRTRKRLVQLGVLEHVGALPGRGKRGTDLFVPVSPDEAEDAW